MPGLLAIFFSSFMVALSGALMPGPFLTAAISESTRRGAAAGPLLVLGHGFLELLLVLALLAGVAPLLTRDSVFAVIALLGGAILVSMAISMLRSLPTLRLDYDDDDAQSAKPKNLIITGMMFSLANPYWTIWWASIGLGYIMHSAEFGKAGVAAFFTGHVLADLAWYSLISFAVARGKRLCSDRAYQGLIGACASLLLVFAFYFLYSGMERLG